MRGDLKEHIEHVVRTLEMSCLGICRSLLRLDRMALEKLALPLRD